MDYVRLGLAGLRVRRIALGCMSYGAPGLQQWTLDADASQQVFRQAVELGITSWDTANGYVGGAPRCSSAERSTPTPVARTSC